MRFESIHIGYEICPVAELSDLVILVRNKRQITDDKNVKKERKTELTTHKVDERHIHDR